MTNLQLVSITKLMISVDHFPQSNIDSMLGYTTFYSQLIRFCRLCKNIDDFLFRAKLSYAKLVKHGDLYSNNTYVSRNSRTSCQLVPAFIINKHIHPFGTGNPKYQFYLNSVIQLLLSILRTISHNHQFNSNAEGSLSNIYLKQRTVHPIFYGCGCPQISYNMILSTMANATR